MTLEESCERGKMEKTVNFSHGLTNTLWDQQANSPRPRCLFLNTALSHLYQYFIYLFFLIKVEWSVPTAAKRAAYPKPLKKNQRLI